MMANLYKLYVRVMDESGRRQSVILVDDTKKTIGTLQEVKARKAQLQKLFPDRQKIIYEIVEVKGK